MESVKAILFDIGGVIYPEEEFYPPFLGARKLALREMGVRVSDEEFDAAVEMCIRSFVPSLRQAVVWHFAKPDLELHNAIIERGRIIFSEMALPERDVRPGMPELIESLAGSYKLGLAANAGGSVREGLDRCGVLKCFESTDVSGDLPFAKPDPRFFEHILRRLAVEPEQALMIGDRLDNDIFPAKLMGMKAIWFKVGPYAILEPRTPGEMPDAVVTCVEELREVLLNLTFARG